MPRAAKKVLEKQQSTSELNVPKDNSPSPPLKKTRKTKKGDKPLNESSTSSLEVKVTKKTDKAEDSPMVVNSKKKFNLNKMLETDDKELKLKQITDKFISDLIELDINLSEANVKYIRKLK